MPPFWQLARTCDEPWSGRSRVNPSWRRDWPRLIPRFDYPPDIRKVIYIESVNCGLRRRTPHSGVLPSDETPIKLLYLVLRNIGRRGTLPFRDWKAALNRFTIGF